MKIFLLMVIDELTGDPLACITSDAPVPVETAPDYIEQVTSIELYEFENSDDDKFIRGRECLNSFVKLGKNKNDKKLNKLTLKEGIKAARFNNFVKVDEFNDQEKIKNNNGSGDSNNTLPN